MIFSNRFLIMAQYNPAPEPPHPQLLSRLALSEEIDSCVIRKGRQRKLSVLVSVLVAFGGATFARGLAPRKHHTAVTRSKGTQFSVTKSTVGTADSQTQVSWDVSDIRAEVAELRSRGVKVEDYDLPGLKTEDGIADIGFAWAAWIIDPGKNALGILQLKD